MRLSGERLVHLLLRGRDEERERGRERKRERGKERERESEGERERGKEREMERERERGNQQMEPERRGVPRMVRAAGP